MKAVMNPKPGAGRGLGAWRATSASVMRNVRLVDTLVCAGAGDVARGAAA
jgi:hypothetical protein